MNDLFDIFLIIIFWLIGFAGGYYFAVSGFNRRYEKMRNQLFQDESERWRLYLEALKAQDAAQEEDQ